MTPKKEIVFDKNGFQIRQKKFLAKIPSNEGGYKQGQIITFSKSLCSNILQLIMEYLDFDETYMFARCSRKLLLVWKSIGLGMKVCEKGDRFFTQ
jgi:hypothetical protein